VPLGQLRELAGSTPVGWLALLLWLVAALALLVPAAARAGATRVPRELVPEQLAHIQAQRRPGDVVLVSAFASFQYAYYAPDRPTFVARPPRWGAVPFTVTYPGREDLMVVGGLDGAAIRRALAHAAARTSRIWIVLGHSEPRRGGSPLGRRRPLDRAGQRSAPGSWSGSARAAPSWSGPGSSRSALGRHLGEPPSRWRSVITWTPFVGSGRDGASTGGSRGR
jgi:hypothetical protein